MPLTNTKTETTAKVVHLTNPQNKPDILTIYNNNYNHTYFGFVNPSGCWDNKRRSDVKRAIGRQGHAMNQAAVINYGGNSMLVLGIIIGALASALFRMRK
ncbi:uncharacterized protein F4822DRAFT_429676 [Hypoxylon trugodes]|uniref:uncharacterized protein n=1 Tax=Hypoxylon trugodes TaxID=326681 RepID=UPI0021A17A6D|nr:uncharacterized protein F4822DRAFT_429676 [Hypoxylon trugodes]KAI1389065.1 hypothetical protein F4822DRAFT_429676 [Hypoxylon trugodes]